MRALAVLAIIAMASELQHHNGYVPNPKQWEFHSAPVSHKLYGGAMGGGKSRALCEEIHALCIQFPGIHCLVGRENMPELKRTTMFTMLDETLCGEGSEYYRRVIAGYNHTDQLVHYRNGSRVYFMPLTNEAGASTLDKLKSMQLGAAAIDEATEVTEAIADLIETRFRQLLLTQRIPYRLLLASNPEPGWIKNRYVSKQLADHIFVPALWTDNREHLPPNYDKRFAFMPEAIRKRYLEGSWDVFEGQVYMDFDPEVHIVPAFEVPAEWPRWRSIDYGFVNPQAALWFAMDWDGNLFVYDEVYEPRKIPSWWKAIIATKSEGQRFRATYGCPRFFQTESDGRTIADEYAEAPNAIHLTAAPVGITARINRVMEFLRLDPEHKHPITGLMGAPRLYLLQGRAANLVAEILEYAWRDVPDGSGDEVREEPQARMNHAIEAMERLVSEISKIGKPIEPRQSTFLDRIYASRGIVPGKPGGT